MQKRIDTRSLLRRRVIHVMPRLDDVVHIDLLRQVEDTHKIIKIWKEVCRTSCRVVQSFCQEPSLRSRRAAASCHERDHHFSYDAESQV